MFTTSSVKVNNSKETWNLDTYQFFSMTSILRSIRPTLIWLTDYGHPINAKIKEIWKFGPMWQTKYALAVHKNLGVGVDFWCRQFPCRATIVRGYRMKLFSLFVPCSIPVLPFKVKQGKVFCNLNQWKILDTPIKKLLYAKFICS